MKMASTKTTTTDRHISTQHHR